MEAALISTIGLLLIALGGWIREWRKENATQNRSNIDILIGGYQDFFKMSKQEVTDLLARNKDCEEREQALDDRVRLLENEVRKLGGVI